MPRDVELRNDVVNVAAGHFLDALKNALDVVELAAAGLERNAGLLRDLVQVLAHPRAQLLAEELATQLVVQRIVTLNPLKEQVTRIITSFYTRRDNKFVHLHLNA